jgi:hypothetical protein
VENPVNGYASSVQLALRTRDGKSLQPLLAEEPASSFDIAKPAIERLYEVIDVQRENLARLDSLLGCLTIAMEYGSETERPPHYPDVARLARELVQQSARNLDALAIQRSSRNKVKDEPRVIRFRLPGGAVHGPEGNARIDAPALPVFLARRGR